MNFPYQVSPLDFIDDYIFMAKYCLNYCRDVLDLCEIMAVDPK